MRRKVGSEPQLEKGAGGLHGTQQATSFSNEMMKHLLMEVFNALQRSRNTETYLQSKGKLT